MKTSDNENGHFKRGEKHTFSGKSARPGKPEKKAVSVIIPHGLAAKFNVVEKEFDDNLPDTFATAEGTYQIVWLNNIGLESKSGGSEELDDDYEIQFDLYTIEGKTEYAFFYYLNGQVYQIPDDDFARFEDKFAVRLRLMDPSGGLGGK